MENTLYRAIPLPSKTEFRVVGVAVHAAVTGSAVHPDVVGAAAHAAATEYDVIVIVIATASTIVRTVIIGIVTLAVDQRVDR